MDRIVLSVLFLLLIVTFGVIRYAVRPEKATMRRVTIGYVIAVVVVGGLGILATVARHSAQTSSSPDGSPEIQTTLSEDLRHAMSGLTGWPVWVVTLIAVGFVVWRGMVPVAIGLTSVKRVHPT